MKQWYICLETVTMMSNPTGISDYEKERGKPLPDLMHAVIQGNLTFQLNHRYRDQYQILSELDLKPVDGRPMVPDIAIYPKMKIDWHKDILIREDAPLGTIEILSPRQSLSEVIEKTKLYFQMGVTSCWIVIPGMDAIAVNHPNKPYKFFSGTKTLEDHQLNIQLPLSGIFK